MKLISYSDSEFIDIEFSKEGSESSIYKSLIIGENGVGKSRLLSRLCDIFRTINIDKTNLKRIGFKFNLEYQLGKYIYKITNQEKTTITENGKEISEKNLPKIEILSISTIFNDKFFFDVNKEDYSDKYTYCGLRETTNSAFINSASRKTIENIFSIIDKNKNKEFINVLDLLDLKHDIQIHFPIRKKRVFENSHKNSQNLSEYFSSYRNQKRLQVSEFENYDETHSKNITKALEKFSKNDNGDLYININLDKPTSIPKNCFYLLNSLRRTGIIGNLELTVSKKVKSKPHFFSEASSGESQILLTLTSLINHINNNSIVFIDEPEVSLHPNWQVRYFSLLDKVLKRVNNCHVIIATHSHFMVTDLNPENSHLVALKHSDSYISTIPTPPTTYGWSPESILYNIFNIRTMNSTYLEEDINKALELIAIRSTDLDTLVSIRKKLESLVFDSKDPLHEIVEEIKNYEIKND
ncbi:TPA: AAA family ATPase [Vibrio harveyi]|uniref:AAA family ATPase n=1 Tax=Vibrio harveyi TaxID=669 RepID=UPI0002FC3374|nr:AAA family ATPase [Vibrio harveyi]HDM8144629.1 AAA family ATPase [Vibrio harveyi]HDM8181421.1 AAA family ATPase [Vibrio harveyi]